jgi:hypothetical protein
VKQVLMESVLVGDFSFVAIVVEVVVVVTVVVVELVFVVSLVLVEEEWGEEE